MKHVFRIIGILLLVAILGIAGLFFLDSRNMLKESTLTDTIHNVKNIATGVKTTVNMITNNGKTEKTAEGGNSATTTKASVEDIFPAPEQLFGGNEVEVKLNGKTFRVHENFKNAMDKLEEYFKETLKITTKDNINIFDVLSYESYVLQASQELEKLEDKIDEDNMTPGDLAYYTDTILRIEKLELEYAGAMGSDTPKK